MIVLHHCHQTRSMRVLWLLNELGAGFSTYLLANIFAFSAHPQFHLYQLVIGESAVDFLQYRFSQPFVGDCDDGLELVGAGFECFQG